MWDEIKVKVKVTLHDQEGSRLVQVDQESRRQIDVCADSARLIEDQRICENKKMSIRVSNITTETVYVLS